MSSLSKAAPHSESGKRQMARKDIGKRPVPRRRDERPSASDLAVAAAHSRYVGSPKHKFGATSWLGIGRPAANPRTVEQARENPPEPPYTMICPIKWNSRDPAGQATDLLRRALTNGQVSPFQPGAMPKFVYARDPEDRSVVYRAHLMSAAEGTYKAYPLTDAEIDDLEFPVS